MNAMKSIIAILTAVLAMGCELSGGPTVTVVPNQTGWLSITWTVRSSAAPSACDGVRATGTEIIVVDSARNVVADQVASCTDFRATLVLPIGTFDADVTLVDASGRAVSTTLPLKALDITSGTELTVDIDFPTESIL